jgi:gas vesicle protein
VSERVEAVEGAGLPDLARRVAELATSVDSPPGEFQDGLERLAHVAEAAAEIAVTADAELVNDDAVQGLHAPLNNARDSLEQFTANGDAALLPSAIAQADGVAAALRQWPTPSPEGQIEDLRRRFGRLRADLTRLETEISQRSGEMSEQMAAATSTVQNSVTESLEQLRQSAENATNQLNERVEQLQVRIGEQEPRLDAAIARQEDQFSAAQEERRRQSEEARAAQEAEIREGIDSLKAQTAELLDEQRAEGNRRFEEIDAFKESARKSTEAIGIFGMAEGFGKDAATQRKAANWLRWLAIAALIATAGLAFWAADSAHNGNFDWGIFLSRVLVSVAVASVATYAIIQSAHHRERERQAQKVALELASIDPYLALLPGEVQIEIKQKLAEAFFGRPLAPIEETGGAHVASIPVAEFIQAIIKLGSK